MKRFLAILSLILISTQLTHAVTWTTLDYPGAISTQVWDIDGSNIVGYYTNSTGTHGFLYNGSTWTTIDAPEATYTHILGIDGTNLVGYWQTASLNSRLCV